MEFSTQKPKKPQPETHSDQGFALVAGAGFEPATFGL